MRERGARGDRELGMGVGAGRGAGRGTPSPLRRGAEGWGGEGDVAGAGAPPEFRVTRERGQINI